MLGPTSFFTRISARSSPLHSALMYPFFTIDRPSPVFCYFSSFSRRQTDTSRSLAPHRDSVISFIPSRSRAILERRSRLFSLRAMLFRSHLNLSSTYLASPCPVVSTFSLTHAYCLGKFRTLRQPPTVRNVDAGPDSPIVLAPPLGEREGEKTPFRQR